LLAVISNPLSPLVANEYRINSNEEELRAFLELDKTPEMR
jgi:hypothetical protein